MPNPSASMTPAADLELHGIVTEEGQVAGTAARGDARSHGDHAALRRILADLVHVRGCGAASRGVM